jgi:hypothetical protein
MQHTKLNCRNNVVENKLLYSSNILKRPPRESKDLSPIVSVLHESLSHVNRQYRINETRLPLPPALETDLPKVHPKSPVMQRIESLEQKIEKLSKRFGRIEATILSILP